MNIPERGKKYAIIASGEFIKDYNRIERRGYDMDKLKKVVQILADGEKLPDKYKDHPLKGDRKGFRDCHISPDWVLIYRIFENELFFFFF